VGIGTVLHPAVLLVLTDGAGVLQHQDRLAAQRPNRWSPFLGHQHRDRSCRDESFRPVARSGQVPQSRHSQSPTRRLFHLFHALLAVTRA
jgi:hypothetical protein